MTFEETEKYALFATIRHSTMQVWENKIGRVLFTLTRYEKLIRVTVPLSNGHLLLMSFDSDSHNIDEIMSQKVVPIITR